MQEKKPMPLHPLKEIGRVTEQLTQRIAEPLKETRKIGQALKNESERIKSLLEKKLWLKILVYMVFGAIIGLLLRPEAGLMNEKIALQIASWLALPGKIFLQLIKMIIIPLVFSSIILGVISSGSIKFLKKIGMQALLFFVLTTALAVLIGMGFAFLLHPGDYIQAEHLNKQSSLKTLPSMEQKTVPERIASVLPGNPFQSMVSGDLLGVVIFSIILGIGLLNIDDKHKKVSLLLLETIQNISMVIIKWAMELVPYAVFGLMVEAMLQIGWQAFQGLALYILTVLAGLLAVLVIYYLIIGLFTKENIKTYIEIVKNPQLLAFSTSSSAAVMPLSLKVTEDKFHVPPAIAQFLIPVGATIDMAGTALYQAVATIFLAQVYHIQLSAANLLLIILITVGASIGTPSAPGVGIIILATILQSVGIPAAGIGLILGVDRLLDMSRTAINVTGDITACVFFRDRLAHLFPQKGNEHASKAF